MATIIDGRLLKYRYYMYSSLHVTNVGGT